MIKSIKENQITLLYNKTQKQKDEIQNIKENIQESLKRVNLQKQCIKSMQTKIQKT